MSPIPLGILAASGVEAVAAGAFDLLASEVLTGTQSSVTFSNLSSTYGSTYQHLQLRSVVRTSSTISYADNLKIQINGSSSSNYSWGGVQIYGDNSINAMGNNTGQSSILVSAVAGNLATANVFGAAIIDFSDAFDSNKSTTIKALGGHAQGLSNANNLHFGSGAFYTIGAIDSITLSAWSAPSLVAGCSFFLYGLRSS